MTYTNIALALDSYIPALHLASRPSETKVILADFVDGKVLSLDTNSLELPLLNNSATVKEVARSVYQEYRIFSNPSHYQDLGQKEGTHYFLGNVNSKTIPSQGEWLNISNVNNGTISCPQKVKSLLEHIIYTIN